MNKRKIFITKNDHRRLTNLLEDGTISFRDRNDIKSLIAELQNAKMVDAHQVPPTVITMNSKLRFVDLKDQSEMTVTLVFPPDSNIDEGKMSVLSPIGTALLGYAEGDTIEWAVPAGIRRIQIKSILYQPEAAGDYHL